MTTTTTTNQPLNRLEFSFNTFDSFSAQDRSVAFMIACCAHMCPFARVRAPFVRAFDPFYLDHSRLSVLVVTREGDEGEK